MGQGAERGLRYTAPSERGENMEQPTDTLAGYRRTRVLYVIEATLAYFISILINGTYIAKVATSLGIGDGTVGIIMSMTNLGAAFQLLAFFFVGKYPVRRWVILFHTVNQSFFALVWLTPLTSFSPTLKTMLFVVLLVCGSALHSVIESPKIAWYMSMVDDRKRGTFTAAKDMIAMVCGMAFGFTMGRMVDHYETAGDLRRAFLVGGITLCVLAVGHTLTLIFSQERPPESNELSVRHRFSPGRLFTDRAFLRVLILITLCRIAGGVAAPFYGTYKVKELGFTMTFVALMDILYAAVRASGALFLGKYADRTSFARLWRLCCLFGIACYTIYVFVVPANGRILYFGYEFFWALYGAGIDNCMINLVYENVRHEDRVGAYALSTAIGGLLGFGVTVLLSRLVAWIQQNGNMLFGIHAYAQQFLSAAAAMLHVVILVWSIFWIGQRKAPTAPTL